MLAYRTKEWTTKWEQWLKNLKVDAVTRLDYHAENPPKDWLYRRAWMFSMRVVLIRDKSNDQLIVIRLS